MSENKELNNEIKEEKTVKTSKKQKKEKVKKEQNQTKKSCKKPLIISLVSGCLAVVLIFVAVFTIFSNKPKEDKVNLFSNNLVAVKLDDGWGYMNNKGEVKINAQFEKAYPFADNGLALVSLDGFYGFINLKGQYVINPIYSEANSFVENNDLTVVKRNLKYGYVNKDGKEVIPCQFENAYQFSNGLAVVKIGGKYGFINSKGKFEVNPIYDYAESFKNNKVSVVGKRIDDEMMYAIVSKSGDLLTDFMLNQVYTNEDYVITFDGTYYGFCKLDLVPLFKTDYQIAGFPINLSSFDDIDEKLIPFRNNETYKYGFLNMDGQVVIEAKYDIVDNFYDGLALVKFDGKYGFIDAKGKLVIANTYDHVNSFSEGYAVVSNDDKFGLIDKAGKVVVEIKYARLSDVNNGLICFSTTDSDLIGYMDVNGKVVIPQEYAQIGELGLNATDDGYVVVKQGDKYGVLDITGKYVINPYLLNIMF